MAVPVFEPESIDAPLTKALLKEHGIGASASLGLSLDTDISSADPAVSQRGVEVRGGGREQAKARDCPCKRYPSKALLSGGLEGLYLSGMLPDTSISSKGGMLLGGLPHQVALVSEALCHWTSSLFSSLVFPSTAASPESSQSHSGIRGHTPSR